MSNDDSGSSGGGQLPVGVSMEERGRNALESGLWNNCMCIVGDDNNKEEIPACKHILAIASPVFATKFFGSNSSLFQSPDTIVISDVEPDVFKKLLQYIYTRTIHFRDSEEALEMCTVANEYDIPDLVETCTVFLKKMLISADNKLLCNILNVSVEHNFEDLKNAALKEVENKISQLVECEEVQTLTPQTFVTVLQRGQLNVTSELSLINAAVQWAMPRCEKTGANLRETLREAGVLNHLRFLTLTGEQFKKGPVELGLLTPSEKAALSKHISGDDREPLPLTLCPIQNVRKIITEYSSFSDCMPLIVGTGETKTEKFTNGKGNLILYGITLASQIDSTHKDIYCCRYEEDLTVIVQKVRKPSPQSRSYHIGVGAVRNSEESSLYGTGFFEGVINYGTNFFVPLLKEHGAKDYLKSADDFIVTIEFKKPGRYPLIQQKENNSIIPQSASGVVMGIHFKTVYNY